MNTKFIFANCSGGLCNKLTTLVSSIYISKKTNRSLIIIWNNGYTACCDFNKIFKLNHFKKFQLNDKYLVDFCNKKSLFIPPSDTKKLEEMKNDINIFLDFMKIDKNKFSEGYLNILSKELSNWDSIPHYHCWDNFPKDDKNYLTRNGYNWNINMEHILNNQSPIIIYSDCLIPEFLDLNEFGEIAKDLENHFNDNIIDTIYNIVKKHNINKDVIGFHERRTDYVIRESHKKELQDNLIYKVKNIVSKQKIYIACEDKSVKDELYSMYGNNITFMELNSHLYYKDGNDINSGSNELDKKKGMFRLNDYIIEGLVDLYVLSKTNFKKENCNLQTNDYKHKLLSTYALYAHSISQL